jgi:O-antigen ligase
MNALQASSGTFWRRTILVSWIAAMPVTKTFTFAGTRANLAASDVLTPFGIAFLAWLAFRGQLKFPSLALCLLRLFAVDASFLMNIGDSLAIQGQGGIVVESLKILMLWLQFYVVVNAIRSKGDFLLALRAWLYTSAVMSLIGIAGAMAWQMTGIENEYSLMFRAQGTLADSNLFAAYLALSLLLAAVLWQMDRASRKAVVIVGIILIAGIFFSASRGTMLSLTATVLFLSALAMKWKTRLIGAASLLAVAMAVIAMPNRDQLLASTPYTERLATATVNVNDDAASDRKELWMSAIEHIETEPIFGMGRGTFHLEVGPQRAEVSKVHNTFLGIMCETGLIGVLAFALTFFGDAAHLIRQRISAARPFPAPTRTLLGAMLITMLCGLTISIENFRGLWILIAFLEAYRRLYGAYGRVREAS